MQKLDWMRISEDDVSFCNVVFHGGMRPCGRTSDFLERGRPTHGLLYIFAGKEVFLDEAKHVILVAKAGDLIFLPKGKKYLMRIAEDQTRFSLINFEMMLGTEPLTVSDEIELFVSDCYDGELFSLFHKVLRACNTVESSSVFRRKELLHRLFFYLGICHSERFIPEGDYFLKIKPGVDLLKARYRENLPISELAAVCDISVSSFRSLFVSRYGIPPVQYRNRMRIDRAKELLRHGDVTVSEVAEELGFSGESYFCRCYKKIAGETPTAFSKKESEE